MSSLPLTTDHNRGKKERGKGENDKSIRRKRERGKGREDKVGEEREREWKKEGKARARGEREREGGGGGKLPWKSLFIKAVIVSKTSSTSISSVTYAYSPIT